MDRNLPAGNTSDDQGFTLVELLIVIVILGVLATVTVFAVRGITDQGKTSASDSDTKTLESAQEAHMAKFGTYATEAELVTAGLLRQESTLHDITLGTGDYTIVAEGSGGGGPVTNLGTAIVFGGVPALEYGTGDTFVFYGGAVGLAEWNRLIAAGTPAAGKRVVFVDVATITDNTIAQTVATAPAVTKLYLVEDEVANFAGGGVPLSSVLFGFSPGSLFGVASMETVFGT